MINLQLKIDSTTEEFFKFILIKFKKFELFLQKFKQYHIKEELLFDNILQENMLYNHYYQSLSEVFDKYYYNYYNNDINEELLIEINKRINNEYGFRKKNIIHRHFLHDIYDYKIIDKEIKILFEKINDNNLTTLENYAFLIYNLFKIYPFFNGLSLRFIGNIYLLKNDYLPLILSTRFKSEYYYIFQYDFDRFKDAFLELILKNIEFLGENLGINI